jgi:hypothetical protein
MPQSNPDFIRKLLSLHGSEGFDAVIRYADPEIEIVTTGINAGTRHGIAEGLELNALWEDAWEEVVYEPGEIEEIDERIVVAEVAMSMRGEGSGVDVTGTQWWLFEIRDGLICRWHLYLDRDSAVEAAGA